MVAAPSEQNPFSIEALRAEMDNMIAWSNKLRAELDLNYADHYERMDRLVTAHTGDKDPNTHQAHTGYIGSTDNK